MALLSKPFITDKRIYGRNKTILLTDEKRLRLKKNLVRSKIK